MAKHENHVRIKTTANLQFIVTGFCCTIHRKYLYGTIATDACIRHKELQRFNWSFWLNLLFNLF